MKKENRDWRHNVDKLLGKKRENKDNIIKEDNEKKEIELDETKENDVRYKNQEKEIIKLKMIIDNLSTENSLLKYRLLNIEKNKENIENNVSENIENKIENENNNNLNQENIQKLEELIKKNRDNEEIIKKLEIENNNLKLI